MKTKKANAFGSTFVFFSTHKAKQKNAKELPSKRTKTDRSGQSSHDRKRNGSSQHWLCYKLAF